MYQMPGHKVVLKYKNGKKIKGWVDNFNPNRDIFFLHPLKEYSDSEKLDIRVSDLKAIFFVKDFIGNSDYKKVRTFENYNLNIPTQRRVIAHFQDGEKLYGTSYSYNPTKIGFFIYPVDRGDNNLRIFAINTAIEEVEFLDSFDESYNF
jgi:small nuclear ribonucleoprotein (snRNP)-like protein